MAIVTDRAGVAPLDKSYSTHNRTNAGTPNAVLTPEYVGEIVWDTTNKVRWKAVTSADTGWTPLGPEVT